MKELSIEEKAKAYDEAIEKLRSLHDNYDTVSTLIDIKEELEYIFPELKESEDEKVRKAILELVRQSSEVLDKQNQNNMIAWLEKQGGQKSTEWDEYDEMYVNALIAIVRKRGVTDERLRDELIGWLSCLKCRLGE